MMQRLPFLHRHGPRDVRGDARIGLGTTCKSVGAGSPVRVIQQVQLTQQANRA
jgi:hypothetical protein